MADLTPDEKLIAELALFHKAAAGDRQAKQDIIDLYINKFRGVARNTRTAKTRSLYDSDDILQQFRIKVDQFPFENKHFESLAAFILYLAQIVKNEVRQAERKQYRRPDVKSLENLSLKENRELVDGAPTPFAVQVAEENWLRAVAALKSPVQVAIAGLLRQGLLQGAIMLRLGISVWTIRRVVADLAEALADVPLAVA